MCKYLELRFAPAKWSFVSLDQISAYGVPPGTNIALPKILGFLYLTSSASLQPLLALLLRIPMW
uniref:Uncharacterized protein n=1 Tax=Picea glauca TaxID=3330 RepID=A0A101M0Q9_PICGL|nr:hypothetical protein ABT39_MTgene4101 [Picea glauca]QHR92548.1 hypothetical protein Q903MT_gene6594 [Picea sitchensis]